MKAIYIVCMVTLIATVMVMPASATTVTISPSDMDTALDEFASGGNTDTVHTDFSVWAKVNDDRRGLVHFDLSSIPSGATIDSATLHLYMRLASANRTQSVHRVTNSWIESETTWNSRYTGTLWTTPGGDYVSTPTDSISTGTIAGWLNWNVKSDVQAFVDGTSNYGWLIKDVLEDDPTTPKGAYYYSREYTTDPTKVPYLEVTYTEAAPAQPDLIVTAVWDNQGKGGFLFANETNDITVRINNTGSGDAGAFNVTLEIDSYTETKSVASLAAGANINVTFTGYAPTTTGSKTVNVTADRENAVAESDEANNLLSTSRQVYNNGYKGQRWTGGADIATVETYSIKGNVSYSTGSSAYTSANWKNISASWSPADLPIASPATVLNAKLYVYYNFDATGGALWGDNTTFNSVSYPKAGASHYSDVKGWGLYSDRTYGTLVYNVTSNFNKSGNTASLGDSATTRNVAIDGMILQVVYSDSSEPVRKIWINEGFDLLMADITKGTDTNETIAYAPFTGTIEPANISSARLIAIAPGAGDSTGNKSNVLFNSHSHRDALPPYKGATQIGIADLNVTSELGASNTAAIQDNGDSGGMRASTTILAVEYKPAPTPTPKPANASVSLGASIRAAIAIEVTPSSLNFGELAPGQTSGGNDLIVKNKGGYSINVSAEVTDSVENLFVDGALLNDKLWSLYSAVIPKNGNDKPVAKLHVPEDYAGAGSKEGTMMFWAKKA